MCIHQQNHWNDILSYWFQYYHWSNGPSEFTNRIRFCILDMSISSRRVSRQKLQYLNVITSSFHSYVRSSHSIHMFHSFHGYDEFNKFARSQRMGLHNSVGGALQR